jgi:uncharacterized protein (UPF0332 family)
MRRKFKMDTNSEKYLVRAEDSLESAKILFNNDRYIASVNRSYITMLFCVRGALSAKETFPKSYKSALAKFSEIFIKTGEIARDFKVKFEAAYSKKWSGDFEVDSKISRQEALETLNHAIDFVTIARNYLNNPIL